VIAQPVLFSNPAPRLPPRGGLVMTAPFAATSALVHAGVLTMLVLLTAVGGMRPVPESPAAAARPVDRTQVVFLPKELPGGGGGNREPGPVRRAEAPGRDRITVPRTPRVLEAPEAARVVAPLPQAVVLDAVPLSSGSQFVAGLPSAERSSLGGMGSGEGGGVGSGAGTGIGSGRGPGMGPGSGGGFGGGAYRLGAGVTAPRLLKEVTPSYTVEGMRTKLQGIVELEVVVRADGTPGAVRIVRSLDPGGLDVQAIDAVRQWRFAPGHADGVPVDVLVTIILTFKIS
jgi:TonB family protein